MTSVAAGPISDREAEVLAAVGEHLTNAEIAQRLHISVRTVESHVSSLLRKLAVADRRALAELAVDGELRDGGRARAFRNLPTAWTSFVGRVDDLDEVVDTVGGHRLVTLLGPGGIGKTRLSMAAVERLAPAHGAFVDLVPVAEGGVLQAVAAALGVVERPGSTLEAVVHEHLRDGPALVVLDNCEHVLASAATWAGAALAACPDLVVLATSRERLGLGGEWVVVIPPLAEDGTALFRERASADGAALAADDALVGEVCRRLDGVPLAIELAAARLPSLGLDGLSTGLDDHLRLLGRSSPSAGPEGRHRSLRAVIEWSHELLDDEERTVFRRLSVFAGSFDLAAGAAVVALDPVVASDVVGRLADKSLLVRAQSHGPSRWRLLDTVRAYARERLGESGEQAAAEAAHLRWAGRTAGGLEADLEAGVTWAEPFDDVADDLRAAVAEPVPDDLLAEQVALGLSLGHLAYARGLLVEARRHYATTAERSTDPAMAVVGWRGAAAVARADQRFDVSVEFLHRAAAAAEAGGDPAAAALALADLVRDVSRFPAGFEKLPGNDEVAALLERSQALDPGDDEEATVAIALAEAWTAAPGNTETDPVLAAGALAAARAFGDPVMISEALDGVASAEAWAGHHKEAGRLIAQRVDLLDQMPRHLPAVGIEVFDVHLMTGVAAIAGGDLRAALAAAEEGEHDLVERAMAFQAASHYVIPLALLGEFDPALREAQRMRDLWVRAGEPAAGWMAGSAFAAAMVHGLRGEDAFAAWWALGVRLCPPSSVNGIGDFVGQRVALHRGEFADHGFPDASELGNFADYSVVMSAETAVVRGDADADERLVAARPHAAENDFLAALLRRAEGRRHGDQAALEDAVAQWEAIGARFERACTVVLLPDRRAEGEAELAALGCAPPAR